MNTHTHTAFIQATRENSQGRGNTHIVFIQQVIGSSKGERGTYIYTHTHTQEFIKSFIESNEE